jgi:hypothetical protein
MIINVNWKDFRIRFVKDAKPIFVVEDDYSWTMYSYIGPIIFKSQVAKPEERAERVNFVDLNLTGLNIVKVDSVKEAMDIKFEMMQQ